MGEKSKMSEGIKQFELLTGEVYEGCMDERKDGTFMLSSEVIPVLDDQRDKISELEEKLAYLTKKWKQSTIIGLDTQRKLEAQDVQSKAQLLVIDDLKSNLENFSIMSENITKILKYAKWYWYKHREDKDKCIWAEEKCAEALCQIDDLMNNRPQVTPNFLDFYEEYKEEIEGWYNKK